MTKLRFLMLFSIMAMFILNNSLPLAKAIIIGEPQQIFNEEWTIGIGETDGARVNLLTNISDSDDIIVSGYDVVTSEYMYYLARLSSEGKTKWIVNLTEELTVVNIIASTDNKLYAYLRESEYPTYRNYLSIYNLNTGELIETHLLSEHILTAYAYLLVNPQDPNNIFICSTFNTSSIYLDIKIESYYPKNETVLWEFLYHDSNINIPVGLEYSIYNKLIMGYYSKLSSPASSASSFLIRIDLDGTPSSHKMAVSGGNSINYQIHDFALYNDKVITLGRNATSDIKYMQWYIKDITYSGTKIYELSMFADINLYYTFNDLHLIDSNHFIITGFTTFDLCAESDISIYRAVAVALCYNEDRTQIDPVAMITFGESNKHTFCYCSTLDNSQHLYLGGRTLSIKTDLSIGFVSRYPAMFYEKPDEEKSKETKWYDGFTNPDNFIIMGICGLVGFLVGMLIFRKSNKEIKK